jgi:exopolysaccharide biosynthesis polyprenyl glycosylphosphotransferase
VQQQRRFDMLTTPAAGETLALPPLPATDTRRQYRNLYIWMALTDYLSVVAALLVSRMLWSGSLTPTVGPRLVWPLAPLLTVLIFGSFGLYAVHRLSTAEEFRRILLAVSLTVTTTVSLAFWSQKEFSRAWTAAWWLLALVLAAASRRMWHEHIRRTRASGRLRFRTIVLGGGEEALHLAERMRHPSESNFTVVGHVLGQHEVATQDLPVLGRVGQLRSLVRQHDVDCVVISSSAVDADDIARTLKLRRLDGVDTWVTAKFPECLSTRVSVKPIGGFMALSMSRIRLSGPQALAKRAFDLTLATVGLALTLPLWLVITLGIRLSSPGPVLFRQERVGRGGRTFTLLKFRTMVMDAERLLEELRSRNEADGPLFKLRQDPRVTPIGRWLRRWSLDELPQLFNVLKGDMSMVGPRPPLRAEVDAYEEWQLDRLEVAPGLTGLWQVSGRTELTFDEYVRLDLYYIENWSLAYDLFLVGKTIPIVLTGRGAC